MRSPIPHKKARIEIIPLIDIMFFLLASFMMVSLSQVHMKGIKVNLPAPGVQTTTPPVKDYISVRVTSSGETYFDNVLVLDGDVLPKLMQFQQANPETAKISISADAQALHGDVITLLDRVRSAQIKKIGYQIKTAPPHP
ncbi:MAG: biopolymer transporter ExbD [Verrucomicrobiota bacterium]